MVDGADQFGLRDVQFVVTAVDEYPFGIKKRPHRAVAQYGRGFQSFNKILRHSLQNTRSSEVYACTEAVVRTTTGAFAQRNLDGKVANFPFKPGSLPANLAYEIIPGHEPDQ